MFGWLLIATCAVLSYTNSLWFITGVVLVSVWKLAHWHQYSSRPWMKVHYPMMRAYASASGFESGASIRENREFDINSALLNLLKIVNPDVSISHEALIDREYVRCENFYDESLLLEYLVTTKGIDPNRVQPILRKIKDTMKTTDNWLMVRMVIASVIEEQFSPQDRGEYMYQVMIGNAR